MRLYDCRGICVASVMGTRMMLSCVNNGGVHGRPQSPGLWWARQVGVTLEAADPLRKENECPFGFIAIAQAFWGERDRTLRKQSSFKTNSGSPPSPPSDGPRPEYTP